MIRRPIRSVIGTAIGAAAIGAMLGLSGVPAAAQARPPERPAERLSEPPPERPPEPLSERAFPTRPDPGGAADPAGADPRPAPDTAFGPPAPPAWWPLREPAADHAACRAALTALGAAFRDQPPVTDPDDRDCGIARPIRVARILPGLTLEGGAVMRCDTALALGHWARDFLQPAAARLPGAPRAVALRLGTT